MSASGIIECLDRLLADYDSLLEIGLRKQKAIIEGNTSELQRVDALERQAAESSSRHESELVRAIAANAAPGCDITVTTVLGSIAGADDRTGIVQRRDRLAMLVRRVADVSRNNRELIEQSLAYVNYSLEMYTGETGDRATYNSASDRYQGPAGAGRYNIRI